MTETLTEVVHYFSPIALRDSCKHGQQPLSDAFAFDFKVCIYGCVTGNFLFYWSQDSIWINAYTQKCVIACCGTKYIRHMF